MNPDLTDPPATRQWMTPTTSVLVAGSVVAVAYLLVTGLNPARGPAAPSEADAAKAYLREHKPEPLSGPLRGLLADPTKPRVATERHPLLGQPAPPFTLADADDTPTALDDLLARGPVVLVFYYGYSCDHCVSQLFDLNEDRRYFAELGATVVGVSPDAPAHTRAKYAEYGPFAIPVLSDPDHTAAMRYGVYRPAVGDAKAWKAHGTFVIGRDRRVHWANTGPEPFTGNVTLLAELTRLDARPESNHLPPTRRTQP
jgi:peroxiredoxin Q/BCP